MRTQTYHAMQLLTAERERQVDEEGWQAEHDDDHREGELALAAAAYAIVAADGDRSLPALRQIGRDGIVQRLWPSARPWFRPGVPVDRKRCLVKAGALILAELERLERIGR